MTPGPPSSSAAAASSAASPRASPPASAAKAAPASRWRCWRAPAARPGAGAPWWPRWSTGCWAEKPGKSRWKMAKLWEFYGKTMVKT